MKKKASYLIVLPILSIFLITEINNLNGQTFSNSKATDYAYIDNDINAVTVVPNSEGLYGAKIEMQVTDNASQDFYNFSGERYIEFVDLDSTTITTTELYKMELVPQESDAANSSYVFDFSNQSGNLNPDTNYQILDLRNPGLAFTSTGDYLVNTLFLNGVGTTGDNDATLTAINDLEFMTTPGSKQNFSYINTKNLNGGDPLHSIQYSNNKLSFKIDGTNLENSATGDLDIVLQDNQGEYFTRTASITNHVGDSYSYEITDVLPNGIYTFDSIINSDVTVFAGASGSYNPNSSISFTDDLGMSTDDLTITVDDGAITNPYVQSGGLAIDQSSATANSIKFTLTVVDSFDNSFKNSLESNENILNVKLENTQTSNVTTVGAQWVGDSTNNKYTFIIDGLDVSTNYEIVSIEDSGLAVGDSSSNVDTSIDVSSELSSDGTFSTADSNPYIKDNGFNIIDSSVTSYSMQFQINVSDPEGAFIYENGFPVTLNNGGSYEQHYANFVSKSGDNYIYEINDLESNTSYSFFSIDSSGLAAGDSTNDIDNSIILTSDLGTSSSGVQFKTLANPYINPSVSNGFEIDKSSADKSTIEFTLYVSNWDVNGNTTYKTNDMQIKLIEGGKTNTYNTDFVSHEQGTTKYVYKVTGLNENQSYEVYSLINSGLSTSPSGSVQDEIVISTLGIDEKDLTFSTPNVFNFLWLLLPFFILLIAGIVGGYYFWSKGRRNESSRLNILKRGK